MAGVVPKRSNSGRKQWTLHDGPRGSLKQLRSQLASDGCAESQVILAKELLTSPCDDEEDRHENDRSAVYWLMKASEQGDLEATALLKVLIKNSKGITEHNYMDVKRCINMTQEEKLARKAARQMFASLSNGEDYIMSRQLQKRMLEINKEQGCQSNMDPEKEKQTQGVVDNNRDVSSEDSEEEFDWSLNNNEKLTEDHIVTAAIDYSRGRLPDITNILCLHEPNLHALDHIPAIHQPVLHPFLVFRILYYKLMKFLGSGFKPFCLLYNSNVMLPLLLVIYALVNTQSVLHFFPMLVYYMTFFVMVVSSFQMLQQNRNYQDFRLWSGLFLTYSNGTFRPDQTEYQYIKNNLRPFGHFFLALLINLVAYSLISDRWIPQSELTVIAFVLTFMTLHEFASDLTILFSFAINVLAKYPYETDPVVTQGWRFLDVKIPTFVTYVIGNGVEFCLNSRIIFFVLIPVVFVRIASRKNWKGLYEYLIPHCVTLSWLQVIIINSQGATVFGLLRCTLALVGLVFFLPLTGLATIVLPAAALTKWLYSSTSFYSVTIFASLTSLSLGLTWILARSSYKRYTATFQIVFAILALSWLLNSTSVNSLNNEQKRQVTWEQFQDFCHQPAWERSGSIAVTQLHCLMLENLHVDWTGYVNHVKIRSVSNILKPIFKTLPNFIQNYFCVYDVSREGTLRKDCIVDTWNWYEFEISVRMQSGLWDNGVEVILIANNDFTNFSLSLKATDHIRFEAVLTDSNTGNSDGVLGGTKPHARLLEVDCLSCLSSKLKGVKVRSLEYFEMGRIVNFLVSSLKCVMNFLLNPLVIFK